MGNSVSLVRTEYSEEGIFDSIRKALDLAGFRRDTTFNPTAHLDEPVRLVAIKPNLCYYWDAATGYTTDPRVVAGVIDYVRDQYGENVDIKVVEADASAMRTKYAFKVLGYERMAEEKRVELLNLSRDTLLEKTATVNHRQISFKVPELLLNTDLFINVPKLKIMRATKITCAMKNIFGCIGSRRKIVYHPFLEEAIVGINKILRPHLTVVDGLVALGRFPVKLGLIIAAVDPFSVDYVASQIMGYNPSSVGFLKVAIKEGLGNPQEVSVCGETIRDFEKIVPKAIFLSSDYSWRIQFWLLKAYRKIVGDVIPPILEDG